MDTVEHIHRYEQADPGLKVKLIKNTKSYGWEVTASGADAGEVLAKLREVDGMLRAEYGESA